MTRCGKAVRGKVGHAETRRGQVRYGGTWRVKVRPDMVWSGAVGRY